MEAWIMWRMLFPWGGMLDGMPIVYIPAVLAAYFVPLWLALWRRHPNRLSIGLLNGLLGWMLPGWVAALVWAALAKRESPRT